MSTQPQPATASAVSRRDRRLAREAAARAGAPVSPNAPHVVEPAKPIRWWQRARSAVLLTLLSAALGVLVAVVVGTAVVTAVLLIKHALG